MGAIRRLECGEGGGLRQDILDRGEDVIVCLAEQCMRCSGVSDRRDRGGVRRFVMLDEQSELIVPVCVLGGRARFLLG